MNRYHRRWMLAGCLLALGVAQPARAGRVHSTRDAAFEITRIISQYQGGISETIGPAETTPAAPIAGATAFFGYSHQFPEAGAVFTWRSSEGWRQLDPNSYSFKAEIAGASGATGNVWNVVFQFDAAQAQRLQNAFVLFRIQPQPPGPFGDVIEGLWLRGAAR